MRLHDIFKGLWVAVCAVPLAGIFCQGQVRASSEDVRIDGLLQDRLMSDPFGLALTNPTRLKPRWTFLRHHDGVDSYLDTNNIWIDRGVATSQKKYNFVDNNLYNIEYNALNCEDNSTTSYVRFFYLPTGDTGEGDDRRPSFDPARPGSPSYNERRYLCDPNRDSTLDTIPSYPVEWHVVTKQPNGLVLAIDNMSIDYVRRKAISRYFWLRRDYSLVSDRKYAYVYSLDSVHCEKRLYSREFTIQNLPSQELGEVNEFDKIDYGRIAPNSSQEAVYNYVCSHTAEGS